MNGLVDHPGSERHAGCVSPSPAEAAGGAWPEARWARILDRIEHRQAELGLRYWGPPLWLEVTMSGPDSDQWPGRSEYTESWDWQSSRSCDEATSLLLAGADDDELLLAVSRYTIENLILNAVHEVGEWFRFDGRRVFPAHTQVVATSRQAAGQGNGDVALEFTFSSLPPTNSPPVGPDVALDASRLRRLGEAAPATRFTYLPAVAVHHRAAGPVISCHTLGRPPAEWSAGWSTLTLDALDRVGGAEELLTCVQRDVHAALIGWEAMQICQAFHVDGRTPWHLAMANPGCDWRPDGSSGSRPLSFSIDYVDSDRPEGQPARIGDGLWLDDSPATTTELGRELLGRNLADDLGPADRTGRTGRRSHDRAVPIGIRIP